MQNSTPHTCRPVTRMLSSAPPVTRLAAGRGTPRGVATRCEMQPTAEAEWPHRWVRKCKCDGREYTIYINLHEFTIYWCKQYTIIHGNFHQLASSMEWRRLLNTDHMKVCQRGLRNAGNKEKWGKRKKHTAAELPEPVLWEDQAMPQGLLKRFASQNPTDWVCS